MKEILFDNLPFTAVKEQVYELWNRAFGDSKEFVDAFFAAFAPEEVTHTLTVDGKLVSMLFALPQRLCVGGRDFSAVYIYGVATVPEFRGRGYMRLLMERVEALLAARGVEFVYLLPAGDRLRGFYSLLGYKNCSYRAQKSLGPQCAEGEYSLREEFSPSVLLSFIESVVSFSCSFVRPSLSMFRLNIENSLMQGGGAYMLFDGKEPVAVAFIAKKEGLLVATDVFACDEKNSTVILSLLCERFSVDECMWSSLGEGEPFCMARIIGEGLRSFSWLLDNIKIGFVLDK